MTRLVYLAGPITGYSFTEATDWRERAISELELRSGGTIVGVSPLRKKSYLKHENNLGHSYEDWPLSSQRGIFARDRYDCKRADAILVYLADSQKVSIGTVMEIAWGVDNNIPIVLVMEKGNTHDHPMIREACPFIVDTLEYGIDVILAVVGVE